MEDAPTSAAATQPGVKPPLDAFVAAAIAEYFRRYGETDAGGSPQADTAVTIVALADVAGEIVARLPSRVMRRKARSIFEDRFRRRAYGDKGARANVRP